MAAHFEEVIVPADGRVIEQRLPHGGDGRFGRAARRIAVARRHARIVRHGKPLAVELAVGGEGKGVEEDERGGDHVGGEEGGERGAQVGGGGGLGGVRDDIGDELGIAGVLEGDDGGFANAVAGAEARVDLAELDAKAADLDLMIESAEEFELSVGEPSHEVAGAVEAAHGGVEDGVVDEALGGELGPAEVAAREAGAAEEELAGHADGLQLPGGGEDEGLGVGDGGADGGSAARGAQGAGRIGGVLGGAVEVVDALDAGVVEGVDEALTQGFAGEVDGAHGGGEEAGLQERVNGGGDGVDEADESVGELGQGEDVAHEDDATGGGEGGEDLEDGQVEADRGGGEDAVERLGGKARRAQSMKETALRCSIITPLGEPVEPEV
nr:hypothetical protein [Burkholderia pseudomallei]